MSRLRKTAPVNTLPPPPDPLLLPVRDPRTRDLVLDYADMHALVADLVLPGDASMYVMSAMETSREHIRYSYYRYEFDTVAVTHSLFALEHVLAERLATKEPLHVHIERATDAGLITAGLAAELDRSRLLRDKLMQGSESSAALHPLRAVAMVRAVFDAVSLLLRPPSTAEATAADVGGAQPDDALARLWEDHLQGTPGPRTGCPLNKIFMSLLGLRRNPPGLPARRLAAHPDFRGRGDFRFLGGGVRLGAWGQGPKGPRSGKSPAG
jgi:hypothetical protein